MDKSETSSFSAPRVLGRSGLTVGRLGLSSGYGGSARGFEMAFERGCNYFYWGSVRKDGMGAAIRNLAPRHRERLVIVLQSYSRFGVLLKPRLLSGLRDLRIERADVLLLGWHNHTPGRRVIDTAMELKERGLVRTIAISCHHRPSFQGYINDPRFDIIMVRYNAAHRGAEREVFPCLDADVPARPGVVSYTATRWGGLLDPRHTPTRATRRRAFRPLPPPTATASRSPTRTWTCA